MPRRLTAADVCQITGYNRDELHALLKGLHPYASSRPAPRVAREFTPIDLLVLSVAQALEHRFGLRRASIWDIGDQLVEALSRPRGVSRTARLVISVNPPSVDYVEDATEDREGIVVALGPIFDKVDSYLSFGGQLSLQLGPGLIHARKLA